MSTPLFKKKIEITLLKKTADTAKDNKEWIFNMQAIFFFFLFMFMALTNIFNLPSY
jgi:hypothetical protein